jgi:transcriptional antiterminator RfaH
MFVQIDLEQEGDNVLRWTPGTTGLVRFGGVPATVPQNLIQELKKRIAQIEATVPERKRDLKRGDRVQITEGPFAGYEAIFDAHISGKERVQVLLAYLSYQPHRITLDAGSVEKMNAG